MKFSKKKKVTIHVEFTWAGSTVKSKENFDFFEGKSHRTGVDLGKNNSFQWRDQACNFLQHTMTS